MFFKIGQRRKNMRVASEMAFKRMQEVTRKGDICVHHIAADGNQEAVQRQADRLK